MDKNKLIKSALILTALFIGVFGLTKIFSQNSITLQEYAKLHPEIHEPRETEESLQDTSEYEATEEATEAPTENETDIPQVLPPVSTLMGATLNGEEMLDLRFTYTDSFYYEPLSDNLRRYITGVSFPADDSAFGEELAISYDDLCYIHILHYNFEGNVAEGELICNEYIAQDLVEIFYELYRNEYQIEKVLLIDKYDGDDAASMEDNNTSCFNYRMVAGSSSLSKHALGLAIDVNPLFNPYITYGDDGSETILPVNAEPYADRNVNFPYKIDENDLCYKLFIEHGFTWGGNWNSSKDYQHFQKIK